MNKPRALLPSFFSAAIFLLSLSIAAQPGDETRVYEEAVASLKTLGEKIVQRPDDAALYFQRGSVYYSLFYLSPGDVAAYRGVVYVNDPGGKALDDFNRAIELDKSKSEYYAGRGQIYDLRWLRESSRKAEDATLSLEKLMLAYWNNGSFESAVKDYQKAVSVARSGSQQLRPLNLLVWLYRARATALSFYPPAKLVRAEKKTRLVFDDFDRSLDFARKYLDATAPFPGGFLLSEIYLDKARAAIVFEEHLNGIKILTDGIIDTADRPGGGEELCRLYVLRGDINQKLKDYDAAIRDYTYPVDHKQVNCDAVYEKRGDAYSAKGNWQLAIEDYSRELTKYPYPHFSLLTRRAKAYLKEHDAEKAIADLNMAMTWTNSCSEQYRMRAEAYRMLNDETRAVEDENSASKFSRNKIGCSL